MASSDPVVLLQLLADWQDISAHLDDPDYRYWARREADDGALDSFEVNVRARDIAKRTTGRLCLITEGDLVVALGLIRAKGRSGDLDTLVHVYGLHRLATSVDLRSVIDQLPANLAGHARSTLERSAKFPNRTGQAVVASLAAASEESGIAIGVLQDRLADESPSLLGRLSATTELHDALTLGLRIAGFESGYLQQSWPRSDAGPREHFAFLGRHASEAAAIRHDVGHLGDWIPGDSEFLDTYVFVDPADDRRRVTVIYADREAEERLTGADLIYAREHNPGYVLVQYKRMRTQGTPPQEVLGYRPDRQLREELRRMEVVLAGVPETTSSTGDVGTWRLHEQPFYIKLVKEDRRRPRRGDLVWGMYLPIDLFKMVMSDVGIRGDKLTRPVGPDNIGRYFSNTDFLTLIQGGWIGSTGVTTAHIGAVISEIWETGRSTLLVVDHTPAELQSGRQGRS